MEEKELNWFEKAMKTISDGFFWFMKRADIWICFGVLTLLAIFARNCMIHEVSGDYRAFLNGWYTFIYNNGFIALGSSIGDYTPAYYYIIWFISLFRIAPESEGVMIAMKSVSIFFDFICAALAGLIIYDLTKSKAKTLVAYGVTILGITVMLNSAWWCQCDSIFASFALASIYFFNKKQQRLSMIMFGLSFAFKLQAIFILPVYLVAVLRKEFKFRYFIYIPIVYIAMCLPACFAAGNAFFDRFKGCILVYFNQAKNSYQQVSLNIGSLYSIIYNNYFEQTSISGFAVPFAIAVNGLCMFLQYKSEKEFTKDTYLKLFALYTLLMPFLLPHMHDRYYYLADIIIPLYAIKNIKKFYVPILSLGNSIIGYMIFLFGISVMGNLDDSYRTLSCRVAGLLVLAAIAIILVDVYKEIRVEDPPDQIEKQA